jgi:hypothetical protein
MGDPVILPDRLRGMRVELASAYLGISPSLLQAEVREGRFPAPVRISRGQRSTERATPSSMRSCRTRIRVCGRAIGRPRIRSDWHAA